MFTEEFSILHCKYENLGKSGWYLILTYNWHYNCAFTLS